MNHKELVIAACNCGVPFARKVVDVIREKNPNYDSLVLLNDQTFEIHGRTRDGIEEIMFPNSEIKTTINRSMRQADFVLIQDCETREFNYSSNDAIFAAYSALCAASRADVARKTLVTLSYPYSRQEHPSGREWNGARFVADALVHGCHLDKMIYLDVHSLSNDGFFGQKVADSLTATNVLSEYIAQHFHDVTKIIHADVGGTKVAEKFVDVLSLPMSGFYKRRDPVDGKTEMTLLETVQDDVCLVTEDMIATAGTLVKACKLLKKAGAKKIYAAATHGLFNDPAVERLNACVEDGCLDAIICTNSVYHSDNFRSSIRNYHEVGVERYVAKVIVNLHEGNSLSALLR